MPLLHVINSRGMIPDSVRIYEYIQAMVDNGVFVDGVTGLTDYQKGRSLFTTGKTGDVADRLMGRRRCPGWPAMSSLRLATFTIPRSDRSEQARSAAWVPDGLIIPKKGQNIEASLEFLWPGLTDCHRPHSTRRLPAFPMAVRIFPAKCTARFSVRCSCSSWKTT